MIQALSDGGPDEGWILFRSRALQLICLDCLLVFSFLITSPNIEARDAESQLSKVRLHPIAIAPTASVAPTARAAAVDPRIAEIAARLKARLTAVRGAAGERARGLLRQRRTTENPNLQMLREQLQERLGLDARITTRARTRTPRQIKGRMLQKAVRGPGSQVERARRTARRFLHRNRQLLRIENPDRDLQLRPKADIRAG